MVLSSSILFYLFIYFICYYFLCHLPKYVILYPYLYYDTHTKKGLLIQNLYDHVVSEAEELVMNTSMLYLQKERLHNY